MSADPHTDPAADQADLRSDPNGDFLAGRRIVAFGPPPPEPTPMFGTGDDAIDAESTDPQGWEDDESVGQSAGGLHWLPIAATLTAFAWTAFFLFANAHAWRTGITLVAVTELIVSWAVPVLLILAIYALLALGRRPMAARFARNAALLRGESEALDARLRAVNRELGAARAFLGSQAREIEALGRRAGEQLTHDADRLAGLVQDNSAQLYAIESVSGTALANMERLRADLFPIASAARDAASQIGNAGRVATEQLDTLEAGVTRLEAAAADHAQTVGGLARQLDAAFEAGEARAGALHRLGEERFAALREGLDAFGTDFDAREGEALAALRRRAAALQAELARNRDLVSADEGAAIDALTGRLAALRAQTGDLAAEHERMAERADADWSARVDSVRGNLETLEAGANARIAALRDGSAALDRELRDRANAFRADLDARRDRAETDAREGIERLAARLETLDAAVAERQAAQIGQTREFIELSQAVLTHLHDLANTADVAADTGEAAGRRLATALVGLRDDLDGSRERIGQTGHELGQLTDAGTRLLEILQTGTREGREDLAAALGASEERLATIETRTRALALLLGQANERGEAVSGHVEAARTASGEAMRALDAFHVRAAAEQDRRVAAIEGLRTRLEAVETEAARQGDRARDELAAAIETLDDARRNALTALADDSASQVRAVAERIAEDSAAAVERAVRERSADALGALDTAAVHALEASRESTRQLRDQLALVNELAGNLEQRVARAREQAEEQVDNDFARRVAVIAESLNSHGIDIAAALSNEVGDMEWAAYLRGDRGIFTRRAVRLLEQGEAREIADLYRENDEFRAHVSRYIHDFEAMLRTLLSTRDGNSLSVTLLSSDMGKLYVALAQAIERLRD